MLLWSKEAMLGDIRESVAIASCSSETICCERSFSLNIFFSYPTMKDVGVGVEVPGKTRIRKVTVT